MKIMIKRDQCQLLWNIERFYNFQTKVSFRWFCSRIYWCGCSKMKRRFDLNPEKTTSLLCWEMQRLMSVKYDGCSAGDTGLWSVTSFLSVLWGQYHTGAAGPGSVPDWTRSVSDQSQDTEECQVGAESTLSGVEQYDYLTLTREIYKLCDSVKTVTQDFSGVKQIHFFWSKGLIQ